MRTELDALRKEKDRGMKSLKADFASASKAYVEELMEDANDMFELAKTQRNKNNEIESLKAELDYTKNGYATERSKARDMMATERQETKKVIGSLQAELASAVQMRDVEKQNAAKAVGDLATARDAKVDKDQEIEALRAGLAFAKMEHEAETTQVINVRATLIETQQKMIKEIGCLQKELVFVQQVRNAEKQNAVNTRTQLAAVRRRTRISTL